MAASQRIAPPALTFKTLLVMVLAIRIAAHFALSQPLQSDSLAYFTIAQHMAHGAWPADNFGQHAFYSIGYPALLAPFFALFGASTTVAFGVNLALAVASAGLLALVVRAFAPPPRREAVQNLALLGYALWLPGVWNCTMLARENLSTPLILLLVWIALRLLRAGGAHSGWALGAGLASGAAVLTGTSALPLVGAPVLAILLAARWRLQQAAAPLLALTLGGALALAPWLIATDTMMGRPMLSTNTGFNLYLGNNPDATGRFVSIASTPAGPEWQAMRARMGEAGATGELGQRAINWIAHNPASAFRLAMIKLALFWAPNVPDAEDFALSPAIAMVRVGEVAQYLLFGALAVLGLGVASVAADRRLVMLTAITGFWLLHGVAYIIERYRDPVMPLLIVLAASAWVDLARSLSVRKEAPHAA